MARSAKTPKFELFNSLPNCFGNRRKTAGSLMEVVKDVDHTKLVVEFGCGAALFSIELARRHPERLFVAVDLKSERMAKPAQRALDEGLNNVLFVQTDSRSLFDFFEPSSVDELWITFPDPFPRKRQAKHRQTHPQFLALYRELLKDQGLLHLKTDDQPLFEYSIESLVSKGWNLTDLAFDLNDRPEKTDAHIITVYEQRWLLEGRITKYLQAKAG